MDDKLIERLMNITWGIRLLAVGIIILLACLFILYQTVQLQQVYIDEIQKSVIRYHHQPTADKGD